MSSTPPSQPPEWLATVQKFGLGGTAGCLATIIVQPIDLLKTRMQLNAQGGGPRTHKTALHAMISVVRSEGLLALYTGLSAALLRQLTYGMARLGAYTWLLEKLTPAADPEHNPKKKTGGTILSKAHCGIGCGGVWGVDWDAR